MATLGADMVSSVAGAVAGVGEEDGAAGAGVGAAGTVDAATWAVGPSFILDPCFSLDPFVAPDFALDGPSLKLFFWLLLPKHIRDVRDRVWGVVWRPGAGVTVYGQEIRVRC